MMHLLAQAASPSTTNPSTAPWWAQMVQSPLSLMVLMFVVMYFFIFRSKKNQDKEKQKMLDSMKKGDRVQTIGGILGTVIEARENDILVKVDESSNTKIRFSRSAIHRVLEDGKPD